MTDTDRNRMLKVSCTLAVYCPDCPTITFHVYLLTTHGNHRFNRNAQAPFHQEPRSTLSVVRDCRVFMHLFSNAVTYKLANNTIRMFFDALLDSIADITDALAVNRILNTQIKCFLRHFQQFENLRLHFTDTECIGGITAIPVQQSSTIHGNDITLLQGYVIRHTVYNLIVNRGAYRSRERLLAKLIGETLKSRHRTMVSNELLGNLIKLRSSNSWFYHLSDFGQSHPHKEITLAK